jgi:anti-sigma factor RsiW
MKDAHHPYEVAEDDSTSQRTPHLTDDQFADLALEPATAAVAAHLEQCGKCALEAQQFAFALTAFEQQSRLWAERRSAVHPVPDYTRRPAAGALGFPSYWIGAGAAAALLIAAGIGIASGVSSPKTVEVAGVPAKPAAAFSAGPQQTLPDAKVIAPAMNRDGAVPAGALPTAPVSPARLKADNELLSAIDGELRSDEAVSVGMYGVADAPSARRAHNQVTNE